MSQQNLSLELIKSSFALELSKENYSKLLQQAEGISFTKDNIEGSYEPLKQLRSILKVVDNVHAKGKADALAVCQMWDAAKRDIKKPIEDVLTRKTAEYTKVANEIAEEKRIQETERMRVSMIKSAIENTVLGFAQRVASCSTLKELVDVERMINFEKNGAQAKNKYQEFLPEAVEKLGSLNESVKKQKEYIKELDGLNSKLSLASDEEEMELAEKKEELENRVDELKITTQEAAINSSTNGSIEIAQEVLPQIKARRSTWKFESVDLAFTAKKMPSWVRMELNEAVVDEYLKAKKAEGLDDKEEFEVAGVRFFLQKTY